MNLKERLGVGFGFIQIFVGAIFIITALSLHYNLYSIGTTLGQYHIIGMIISLVLGPFSIISGFSLIS